MKAVIRQIKKYKGNTIINVMGLSLGITCALVLFLMIQHSTGYDTYHKNADQVYRVVTHTELNGNESHSSGVPIPLVKTFREEFAQASIVVPVNYIVGGRVSIIDDNDKVTSVYEENEGIVYLDENFYKLLDRKWLIGNNESSLLRANQVVLSERMAEKYFHSIDVVGRTIQIDGVGLLNVSGVIENFPETKTQFPFDIIISYKTFEGISNNLENWYSTSSDFQCYVLIRNEIDVIRIRQLIPAYVDKYFGQDRVEKRDFELQPLSDIHFDQNYGNYTYRSVSKENIWAMGILGFFLIITACINFINLSTAQAVQRFREVGIRKIMGSSKWSITVSFFMETAFVTLVSLVLAIGFTELALFKVNDFLDLHLSIDFHDVEVWYFLVALWIAVSLIAGFYPAYIISKYQPVNALKGIHGMGKGVGFFLRKALVIFQFTVSQVLIIGTIVTSSQLNFFKDMSVGFRKDGIINIRMPEKNTERNKTLKTKLAQLSKVEIVSLAYRPPASTSTSVTNFSYEKDDVREQMNAQILAVDEDFLKVFEIPLIQGEGLIPSDTFNRLVVNMAFAREMGFQFPAEAIGESINMWGRETTISGVVEDFYTVSVKEKVRPVAMFTNSRNYETAAVRLSTMGLSGTIKDLEGIFNEVYPGYDFNYEFMDQQFARFYEGEQKMADILVVFSGIAIFIGCLGLFGLVSYMANKKTKEIGIRKVLGASVPSVVLIFSKEFTVLVLIAFGIAAPMSYFGMNQWLQSYANKIDLTITMFLMGILLSMGIALLTIGYKSIEASLANPVDALRDE